MAKRIHIIIAEPSTIIRCGVASLLQRIQDLSFEIAEISVISTLSSMTFRIIPDILIINPSYAGQYSTSQLKSEMGNENLRIVALQSSFADQNILQSYDDVISLYDSAETISEKIIAINEDEDDSSVKKELSIREKEIIVCVVKGMTNKLIAETLNLSTHTVIAHRRNIANKLQIHSPSGLTIYAIVNKLVDLSDIKKAYLKTKEIYRLGLFANWDFNFSEDGKSLVCPHVGRAVRSRTGRFCSRWGNELAALKL